MENLPYRQGVYAFVLDSNKNILLVHKKNSNTWDFPGGGIDEGETLKQAIKREIFEELGIVDFEIIHESDLTYKYDWPDSEREKNFKKSGLLRRGQEQHYFILQVSEDTKNKMKLQEEELNEITWVPQNDIKNYMSYPDQFEVLKAIFSEYAKSLS